MFAFYFDLTLGIGLKELLEVCFNAAMEDDKQLIREYTSFWSLYIRDHQQAMPTDQVFHCVL